MTGGKYMPMSEAKRFKVWLAQNEINQSQFAKKCGVSRAYICSVINGYYYITPKLLKMFADRGFNIRLKKDR